MNAWASVEEHLVAGTVRGRLLVGPGEWESADEFDSTVRSLVGA
ncbi:hypothetical protein [Halorussus salinisoli]|nr:hypothetical protein [Halorussus salinisoli]